VLDLDSGATVASADAAFADHFGLSLPVAAGPRRRSSGHPQPPARRLSQPAACNACLRDDIGGGVAILPGD